MAATLHDPAHRASFEQRLGALSAASKGRWGTMSVDQMLWHCNKALATSMGEEPVARMRVPIPAAVLKFMVLNLPWVKGAPTSPDFVARTQYDFDAERARMRDLLARFAAKPVTSEWGEHPAFGRLSGADYSRLQAKHLNHHFTQFGV
jgi:hypothetical protein